MPLDSCKDTQGVGRAALGSCGSSLTSYCPSLRASSTLGTSCRLPRKSSSEKQREAASSSTRRSLLSQACPQAEQEHPPCLQGHMLTPGGGGCVGLVRRQQGTGQMRTPVCQPGSIPDLHDLGQDFPSVSSSMKWDYPMTFKAPQALFLDVS